jgi:hypothetical protein
MKPYVFFPTIFNQLFIFKRLAELEESYLYLKRRRRSIFVLSTLSLPTYIVAGGSLTVEVK